MSKHNFFAEKAFVVFLLVSCSQLGCSGSNSNECIPSSCGNIHNISYPFRLNTDHINCGLKEYTLYCEENLTVVYLDSAKYYVQSINYNNFTIRVVDADIQKDNCSSIPRRSLNTFYNDYWRIPYRYYDWPGVDPINQYVESLVFIKCEDPILGRRYPLYVDASACINSSGYWYVMIRSNDVTDMVDSCLIEQIVMASFMPSDDVQNISYMELHQIMAYGFELSWFYGCCDHHKENRCRLNATYIHEYCYSPIFSMTFLEGVGFGLRYLFDYRYHVNVGQIVSDTINFVRFLIPFICTGNRGKSNNEDIGSYFGEGLILSIFWFVLYRVALFLVGVLFVVPFLIYKWRRRHLSEYDKIEEFLERNNNFLPIRYSYSKLRKITKGFKDKLGEGGYGSVYKAKLRSGQFAAIKMLNNAKANGEDFINEIATIGRIHHVNVVQLIGFSVERSKCALVYEFMPNGSLDKYLFSQEDNHPISIKRMYEISLGVARGIDYIHQGCNMQILHFDIKPHNILLDEKLTPKISDFGLAKLYPTNNSIVSLTAARGTMGYIAPELVFKNIGGISYKADVYSFGVLLMEIVGRRKSLNPFVEHLSQIYFPTWIYEQFNKGKEVELGDVSEEEKKIEKKMVLVALWCMQWKPIHRPSMHKVIEMLEGECESIEMPPKHSLSLRDNANEYVGVDISLTTSTNIQNICST